MRRKAPFADRLNRLDTGVYEEALDDFGSNADDFM